jgi:processive 1,2-diacylglycerol beta-glucosyltransferase
MHATLSSRYRLVDQRTADGEGYEPWRERRPRVLVLSASAGFGHMRAAEAVELAVKKVAPDAIVRNVDVLKLSIPPFRFCYGQMYIDMIDVAPQALGFFYNRMDQFHMPSREPNFWDRIRVRLEKMSMPRFVHLLQSEPWDVIINTHFLSAEIIAMLCRRGQCSIPQSLVITDFEAHRLWAPQPCSRYFVATEEIVHYLQCYNLPADSISLTGIPIHPVFAENKDATECRVRHGISTDRPVILQLAGGNGVGPIEDVYRSLLGMTLPVELVVVTGRNEAARKKLEAAPVPAHQCAKVLGFTREIDELMAAADIAVTKPGGLTTSESLARGLPLAIVNPVPGQEDRNSDFLLEEGAAIKINHINTMAFKVEEVLQDRERLARLKANARRLGRPRAAYEVAEQSLALLEPAAAGRR